MVQSICNLLFLLKQFVVSIFLRQYVKIYILLCASCRLRNKGIFLDGRHGIILGMAWRWAPKQASILLNSLLNAPTGGAPHPSPWSRLAETGPSFF